MATWSKVKRQLESFLSPSLIGRVEYRATSYRYAHDKAGRCHITVDKTEVLSMCDLKYNIKWYQTVNEVIKDNTIYCSVNEKEIEALREETKGLIPEDRLAGIIRKRKLSDIADSIVKEQAILLKSDFFAAANQFLSTPIEESLDSSNILLNIFALVDRRIGKSRLRKIKQIMSEKHPVVRYFYDLRCEVDGI